jgi:hypothetical protein
MVRALILKWKPEKSTSGRQHLLSDFATSKFSIGFAVAKLARCEIHLFTDLFFRLFLEVEPVKNFTIFRI